MQLDPRMTKIDLIYLFEADLIDLFRIFELNESNQFMAPPPVSHKEFRFGEPLKRPLSTAKTSRCGPKFLRLSLRDTDLIYYGYIYMATILWLLYMATIL